MFDQSEINNPRALVIYGVTFTPLCEAQGWSIFTRGR